MSRTFQSGNRIRCSRCVYPYYHDNRNNDDDGDDDNIETKQLYSFKICFKFK